MKKTLDADRQNDRHCGKKEEEKRKHGEDECLNLNITAVTDCELLDQCGFIDGQTAM